MPPLAKAATKPSDDDEAPTVPSKPKKEVVATHRIATEPFSIAVDGVNYSYEMPYLVDNEEGAEIYKSKCTRVQTEWDLVDTTKERMVARAKKSFGLN